MTSHEDWVRVTLGNLTENRTGGLRGKTEASGSTTSPPKPHIKSIWDFFHIWRIILINCHFVQDVIFSFLLLVNYPYPASFLEPLPAWPIKVYFIDYVEYCSLVFKHFLHTKIAFTKRKNKAACGT